MINLSIIIPTFNVELYIEKTLHSLLCQSNDFNYEIIIVDDGSTDRTVEIVNRVLNDQNNFIVIKTANRGAGHARNIGLEHAKGEYVYFLDSDDLLTPNMIQKCMSLIYQKKLDLYMFSARKNIESKNVKHNFEYTREDKNTLFDNNSNDLLLKMFENNSFLASPCLYISRLEDIKKSGLLFPEGIIFEDNYFTLFNMVISQKIETSSEAFYIRNVRENSVMTSTNQCKSFNSIYKIYKRIMFDIDKYGELNQKCKLEINKRYFKDSISKFYNLSYEDKKANFKRLKEIFRVNKSIDKRYNNLIWAFAYYFKIKIKRMITINMSE